LFPSDEILKKIEFDDVEKDVFEINVQCKKIETSNHNKKKKSNKMSYQIGNKKYKIKRPFVGSLTLELFCQYCDNYYNIRIASKPRIKILRKRRLLIHPLFSALIYLFFYNIYGLLVYLLFIYKTKLMGILRPVFLKSNNKHETKVVRKYRPIGVTFSDPLSSQPAK